MHVRGATLQPPHFLALFIANTQILSIQKHCRWHIWCRGMCVWGAMRKTHIFVHYASQTSRYWVSKSTVAGIFDAEVCAFGAPRRNPRFSGILHFKHTHCWWHIWCAGMCAGGEPHYNPHIFWQLVYFCRCVRRVGRTYPEVPEDVHDVVVRRRMPLVGGAVCHCTRPWSGKEAVTQEDRRGRLIGPHQTYPIPSP